ncbi:MAG: tRNA threonylcarbamoyladenosine biosynthesis protein RimN [Piscirickettsiaceae bacterium]|nr:MAG: tRNA threonylcarbamoyladenosine biosynthesis protein RimN [Piscirickettsiaceae bacterium]
MPSAWQKRRFVECLRSGGIVAYPTEAVFGLGCDPMNKEAVQALLRLKNRNVDKGLILLASDCSQLEPYVAELAEDIIAKIYDLSQEPTTWLLPAKRSVPKWLTGKHKTIAVRVTRHGLANELCSLSGMAIVSTSANMSGCMPCKTAAQARLKFFCKGVFTINGAVGSSRVPSRIIDLLANKQIR